MTSHLRLAQKRSDVVSSMTAVMAARVTELQSGVDAMKGVVDKLPAVTWGLDKNAFTRLKQELDKLVLIDKPVLVVPVSLLFDIYMYHIK
jgi:hypothetical protein